MQSRVIFNDQHYTASAMRDGSLIVESNRRAKGTRGYRVTGPDAVHWIDAIETAIDNTEKRDLCRAIMNP